VQWRWYDDTRIAMSSVMTPLTLLSDWTPAGMVVSEAIRRSTPFLAIGGTQP
jgi:hypothetical protein